MQRIHLAETLAAREGAGVEMHVLEDAGHWVISACVQHSKQNVKYSSSYSSLVWHTRFMQIILMVSSEFSRNRFWDFDGETPDALLWFG